MNFTLDKYLAPGTIEKRKSWEPFWSYQLNSTANLVHLPQNWAKWTKLAVIFLISINGLGYYFANLAQF